VLVLQLVDSGGRSGADVGGGLSSDVCGGRWVTKVLQSLSKRFAVGTSN